jgi:Fur family ferric uptake transcriptional regulator
MSKLNPTRRRTSAQNAVLNALQHDHQSMSAQEIYTVLRSQRTIGLATIYRALDTLQKSGLVQHRVTLDGTTLYSLVEDDCHYMTCLHCGQSIPVDDCPIMEFEAKLQGSNAFKIYYHTLEFFGLCEPCIIQKTGSI